MCLYARDLHISDGQHIQRILRRSTSRVKVRRAQVVLASNQGYKVPAIFELVHYSEHHVRSIIKDFNERGLMAEIELSVLSRQCLNDYFESVDQVTERIEARERKRNEEQTSIDWRFTTTDARIKLRKLYLSI